jgi:plasmid replication initiation protein
VSSLLCPNRLLILQKSRGIDRSYRVAIQPILFSIGNTYVPVENTHNLDLNGISMAIDTKDIKWILYIDRLPL